MNKENLELWNRVTKIDPKHTKKVKVQGKQPFTNIDTYYLLQRATEEFGSYGKGFGIKSMSWSDLVIGDTTLLILDAVFFFPDGEFPIRNSLKMAYMTQKGYMMIDEDAPKKLTTNTIAKALSYIGFGASVYLGQWEDAAYVNEMLGTFTMITPEQRVELSKLIQDTNTDLIKFNESFSINTLTDLPIKDFEKAKAMLMSKKAKMSK
jgi:hypothetical protein